MSVFWLKTAIFQPSGQTTDSMVTVTFLRPRIDSNSNLFSPGASHINLNYYTSIFPQCQRVIAGILKIDDSLHPDISLKPSSHSRLPHHFPGRNADIKSQAIDLQAHDIQFFSGHFVFDPMNIKDLAKD